MVPYERNECFVGRDYLLTLIFDELCNIESRQYNHRVALYGVGGVGKTQTALEYVYSKKTYYSSVFWINGRDQVTLLSGFQEIALKTNCTSAINESNPATIARKVLHWLEQESSWLLVIDTLDDISVVSGLLPSTQSNGHVLITTRNANTSGIPAQGIEISVLDAKLGAALFNTLLGSKIDVSSPQMQSEIQSIVKEFGGLPLGIEQAATYIRQTRINVGEFLRMYKNNRSIQRTLRGRMLIGYQYTVATTWQMSLELLQHDSPEAYVLLQLFAFLNSDVILIDFLQAGGKGLSVKLRKTLTDVSEFGTALVALQQYSLIKRDSKGEEISVQRLLQASIRNNMKEDERLQWWDQVAQLCLEAFPPEITEATRLICRRFKTQVSEPLSQSPQIMSLTFATVCSRVGMFLLSEGDCILAENLLNKACTAYRAIHGSRHPFTLKSMANLATSYWEQGRHDESVAVEELVLEACKQMVGMHHDFTLKTMTNLANTYREMGKWGEAAAIEETVLKENIMRLGEEHPETLKTMTNLAITYREMGRLSEAAAIEETLLKVNTMQLGEEHPETLKTMTNLAITYREMGRLSEAAAIEETVLKANTMQLGEEHPYALRSMSNLVTIYRLQQHWDQSIVMEETLLLLSSAMLGEQHPDTLTAIASLASSYQNQKRWDDAVMLQEKVLEGRRAMLGERHPDTLTAMTILASSYQNQKRWDDAVMLQENVLEGRRAMLGEQHPDTLTAMESLAMSYHNQKRWDDAVMLQEKVLEVRKEILGFQNGNTRIAMNKLASYRLKERWIEAAELEPDDGGDVEVQPSKPSFSQHHHSLDKLDTVRNWLAALDTVLEASSEMGDSGIFTMSSDIDSDTLPTAITLTQHGPPFPLTLTTLLTQAGSAAEYSQNWQSGKVCERNVLLILDDITRTAIEAWFECGNYLSSNFKGGVRMVDEIMEWLSMLVGCPASRRQHQLTMEVSWAYLLSSHQFVGVNPEKIGLLTRSFASLSSMYPDERIVRFALSSAYLHAKDYYHSLSNLLQMMPDDVDADIGEAISKVTKNWISQVSTLQEICPQILVPRILQYTWRSPSVFKNTESLPLDLPFFISLTQVTMNDRPVGVRVDQLRDYAVERWGYLGSVGFTAYQQLVNSVLKDPKSSQVTYVDIPWISSGYTITVTYDSLSICAICQETEWNELVEFFLWIDRVIGLPEVPGIHTHPDLIKTATRLSEGEGKDDSRQQGMLSTTRHDISKLTSLKVDLRTRFPSVDINNTLMSTTLIESFTYGVGDPHLFPHSNSLCWTKLFERAFVGSSSMSHLMPYLQIGKGLSTSFDIMVAIAGVEKVVIQDGGIILVGFCSALIPIQILNESNSSVQWHFMEHEDKETCFHAIHNCEEFWKNVPNDRLLETSFDKLKGQAYIGWHEKVKIALGTEKLASPPGYSDVPRVTEKWGVTQKSIAFGLSYAIPLGPTASMQRNRASTKFETLCRFRKAEQFSVRVTTLHRSTSFIYDDGRKTAWLCPTIYIILFMLRSYLESELQVDMPKIAFPRRCAVSTNDHAFIKSVKDLEQEKIPGEKSMTFDSLLNILHDRYDDASSSQNIRKRYSDSLIGVELRDLMDIGCENTFPKQLQVENGIRFWSSLVETDLIVFCKDLGNVIEPVVEKVVDGGEGCRVRAHPCLVPPAGENILICPLYLLKGKLERRSCNKTGHSFVIPGKGGYTWQMSGTPYTCSEKGIGSKCDGRRCWPHRIQQLVPLATNFVWDLARNDSAAVSKFSPSAPISIDGDGALCFGLCAGI
jgi:tetratricopeptide (TPR) repeat protein